MLTLTLRGLRSHKRRLVSTVVAVLLGVAFMAGSMVFTDTMRASLAGVFADAERQTDALVRGPATIEGFNGTQHAPVDRVRGRARSPRIDGVEHVAARVEGYAQVVGAGRRGRRRHRHGRRAGRGRLDRRRASSTRSSS